MLIETRLDITVSPKSSQQKIQISDNNVIKIHLHSPPSEGKANKELIHFLSKKLKIAKSYIIIEKGDKGRRKTLLIQGLQYTEIIKRLVS